MEQAKFGKIQMVRHINLSPDLDQSNGNPIRTLLEALKRTMVLHDFDLCRPNWSVRGTRLAENHYPSAMSLNFISEFSESEELTEAEDSKLKDILEIYQQFKTQVMLLGARVEQKDNGGDPGTEKEISPKDYQGLEVGFEVTWLAGEQVVDKVKGQALIHNVELDTYDKEVVFNVHWLVNLQPVIDIVNLPHDSNQPTAALNS